MSFRVAVLLAFALAASGCLNAFPGFGGAGSSWKLDCTLGAREVALGGNWTQPCVARASHTLGEKQEIWLAVNPTDPKNVVMGAKDLNPESSNHCVWNGLSVTHDAGATWKDVVIGGKFAERQPGSTFYGYACNTDPIMAWGKDGALHYVVEAYNLGGQNGYGPLPADPRNGRGIVQPGWDLVMATSHDGGDTWPQTVDLLRGDGFAVLNDYSRMAISPKTGTVFEAINTFRGVAAQNVDEGNYDLCSVIASRDHGRTADTPVEVTGRSAPTGSGCQAIAVSPAGKVVLLGDGGDKVAWSVSNDDGKTFSEPVFIDIKRVPIPGKFNESQYRTGTNFEAAYDLGTGANAGTLYLLTAERLHDEADVALRTSHDDGKTWSAPVQVNDDKTDAHQFLPNLAIADDGSVHVFFMDKRYDPGHKLIDITHALSTDGGKTWTNERVTAVSFDGDLGKHQENFPFIGDYIGAACVANDCWAGFPDATTGITVTAAAHVHRG